MRNRNLLTGIIFACLLTITTSAIAVVDAAATAAITTALAGKTVSNIINEFRLTGVSLIDQATHSGNALLSRAGNEANVIAGNLDIIFKDNINLTFDKLSDERRSILIESEAWRRSLKSLTDTAYNFKDSTVLDIDALANKIPFVKDVFFIQSIRGLSYLPQPVDMKVQVFATALGIQDDTNTAIQVLKGHGDSATEVPNVVVDQTKQRFMADITIPNKILETEFKESELNIVPMTLRFNVSKNTGWWIFSRTKSRTYDVPIYLSLFPKKAASLVATINRPTYGWVPYGDKAERYTTPNRHCESDCRNEPTRGGNRIEFAVSGGGTPYKVGYKRLQNPRQRCIAETCGWSGAFNLRLTENDTRLIFTWDTWSRPGTWEASADVYQYQVIGESSSVTSELPALFGNVIDLSVPSDFSSGTLTIKTFTKQTYQMKIGEADPYGIVTYQGKSDASPGLSRILFRVNEPQSVSSARF